MRNSGCSTAVIALHRLWEGALFAFMNSVGRSDSGPGFAFGTDTERGLRLGLCRLNFGSWALTGVSVVIVGLFVAAKGKVVCAPGVNPRGVNGSRTNARTASKVIHKTVK